MTETYFLVKTDFMRQYLTASNSVNLHRYSEDIYIYIYFGMIYHNYI